MKKFFLLIFFTAFISFGCAPVVPSPQTATVLSATATLQHTPTPSLTPTPKVPGQTITSTAQARLTPIVLGPDLDQFPANVNPLTGLRVKDPSMLDLPAVLVSISNMPPTARPQAGVSFAAWIFELFIGEGTSRFMGVFYGDLPRRIPNATGDCQIDTKTSSTLLAPVAHGRIWLDENEDGIQQPWEVGVGGVCVSLYDTVSGEMLQTVSSSSNGYYGFFNTLSSSDYTIFFELPDRHKFTLRDVGNDDEDSDVDPADGTTFFRAGNGDQSMDAGLILTSPVTPTYSPADIAPERTYVGPIRSGRLTYNQFYNMFPGSCLVYASAGEGIRQALHGCEIIFGERPDESPNTALLDVSRMRELAGQNKIPGQPVNYSGNLFSASPPAGGEPANSLWTYFHAYTQTLWLYDKKSGTYLRQTDDGDGKGIFHPDSDRLTGRQLAFENIIIVLADYRVVRHQQYDINFHYGLEGYAYLFRDGRLYKIRWSTANRDWEKKTGLLRPIHFIGIDPERTGAGKQPFALKPGQTWISIMTINSLVKDLGNGAWKALFAMPNDPPPD